MNTHVANPSTQEPPVLEQVAPALAKSALQSTPDYINHISGLFDSCLQHLRTGADQQAMLALARGADDLHQFTLLVQLMVDASEGGPLTDTARFRQDLDICVNAMQRSLVAEDLIAVSDHIADELLPLLGRWGQAADELSQSFAQA
jgi:hypothetical protein